MSRNLVKREKKIGALEILYNRRPQTLTQWWSLVVIVLCFVYFSLLVSPLSMWASVVSVPAIVLGSPLLFLKLTGSMNKKESKEDGES